MSLMTFALLGLATAQAGVHRVALLVGNNEGGSGTQPLYFAEQDTEKIESVLLSAGGYEDEHVYVTQGRERMAFLSTFGEVREDIRGARERGDEVMFFFYYSGHADTEGLQLGSTRVDYADLEGLLDNSGADVRLAFIDACSSGALTRSKGATPAPSFVFDVSERLGARGTVIVTSSSADEASQESDEIAGSYFTYYLASGLSGQADDNGDQLVTFSEVYSYVYAKTIQETSRSAIGTQHPTFDWDLAGEGDVVLADLSPARAQLLFPAQLTGTFAIFDVGRSSFVGEVAAGGQDRRMALRPGDYLVQVRYPTYLQVAELRIDDGETVSAERLVFRAVEYENDVAKGMVEQQVKRAKRPDRELRLVAGIMGGARPTITQQYFPVVGISGLSLRTTQRHRFLTVDMMAGSTAGTIAVPGLPGAPMEVRASYSTLGVAAGYASGEWNRIQVGAGVRLSGLYLRRDFLGGHTPGQSLTAIAPGGVGFIGWHPGMFTLDLEWHNMLVPYELVPDQAAFGANEVLLAMGLRW